MPLVFTLADADSSSCVVALAAAVIALVAVCISTLQWRLASHKFRLDLFEKRHRVYQAAIRFLYTAINFQGFEDIAIVEFNVGTSEANFLFASDVTDRLEEIRMRASRLRTFKHQYEGLPVGGHRISIIEKEASEREWLSEQILILRRIFLPYLGFQAIEPFP